MSLLPAYNLCVVGLATAQFQQEVIGVESVDFNVYHAGRGDPLLLLHGFPETARGWSKMAPPLADHFHVIVPDLPGYGDSRIANIDGFDFSKRNIGRLLCGHFIMEEEPQATLNALLGFFETH